MMCFFIPWDVLFTSYEIWGFNENYTTGYQILNLPIEEWLFFICIPYACVFTHFTLIKLYPKFSFSLKLTRIFTSIVLILSITLLIVYFSKCYTLINFSYLLVLLTLVLITKPHLLNSFLPTFLVILIPFFIVNGILTGTVIEEPIVWYNNAENMRLRMGSIPFEDLFYAFGMLLTVVYIMKVLQKKT